jgi:hypothetical protein
MRCPKAAAVDAVESGPAARGQYARRNGADGGDGDSSVPDDGWRQGQRREREQYGEGREHAEAARC